MCIIAMLEHLKLVKISKNTTLVQICDGARISCVNFKFIRPTLRRGILLCLYFLMNQFFSKDQVLTVMSTVLC